ncbi:MAG: DUF3343 domain-containing protein [Mucinivorans sp.]
MYVIIFQNVRAVMRAEKMATAEKLAASIIPIPEIYSSECGMAISVETNQVTQFKELLVKSGLKFEIHEL